VSEARLQALSQQSGGAEQLLFRQAREVVTVRVSGESAHKDSAFELESRRPGEADIAGVAMVVKAVRRLSEDAAALTEWKEPYLASIQQFPPLFEEFCATRWALLWPGNRDGSGLRRMPPPL
jgi:hypothetical protein